MAETGRTVWGIHGGKTGDADTLFLKHNCVALGWGKIGDLTRLGKDRNAFKDAVAERWPDKKPGAIVNNAGQLFRFVHEPEPGDLVAYPSKHDRHVHIGKITGGYFYSTKHEEGYPNRRPVEWKASVPRTRFSQGALYEIGSALSFFRVKTYAEEFRVAAEGKPTQQPIAVDETVVQVAENIEESTRDFVLKRLAEQLKGHPLARFVGHLLEAMGYRTRVSPEGPDGGVDILAHKDELGFEPPLIKVQVKATEGTVGGPIVSSLYGRVGPGEHGLFVTLGRFTDDAVKFARPKGNLRLIDGAELVDLVFQHYERFDALHKGLIPLKRVYVPEVIEETSEE